MSFINEITDRFTNSPYVQSMRSWYRALPGRDQLIVKALSIVVAAALIFVVIYAPLLKQHTRLQARIDRSLKSYNLIADNAYRFGGGASVQETGGPILSIVTQEAYTSSINLSRYEQDGLGLRIWVDKTAFDDFVAWLEVLRNQHGIRVSQINVDLKNSAGWVDVRATLSQ